MILISSWVPGTALAGSVGDVVTQVSKANLGSTEFNFGQESATGYGFAIHAGMGDYGDGGCMLSVLGPVQPDEIQIMIDYVDGISQVSYIRTTQMKGCEVREYTTDYGVGIGVVLPDYFITVEMLDTGLNQGANMAAAKSIAQQTLDGLERAGLLSQAAPDIESGKTDKKQPAKSTPPTPAVVTGNPLDEPVQVSDTMNIAAVQNGPTVPTTFSINGPHLVTYILNYHWNSAQGATPGTIALQDSNGKTYGPWQATGTPGQGGAPNANWEVSPNIVIPAGTYTIVDSDPATWSQNADSGGKGMGVVKATPHFEVTSGSVNDLNKGTPGSSPGECDCTESPAGVGSVGNIPGPSNTTEAVTGVVVPGLISIGLGALGGLGGGGFIPPAGGTPMYPTGGGPSPLTGGSYPGTGNARPGAFQEVNQLGGRRRGEEFYVDTGAIGQKAIDIREVEQPADHGMIIDTADMFETPIAVQPEPGVIIDTADEAGIFVQPEPRIIIEPPVAGSDVVGPESGMIIDNADMFETPIAVQPEPGVIIDTADEAGIFVQPEPEIYIDTVDMHEQAIDIREPGGETGIHIDTTDMFEESPVPGAIDEKGIFIETEDETALFVKSGSDLEMEAEPVKPQAFNAREGEAGGAHFATAENSEGAPAAAQSEHLYTDAGDSEVLRDSSSLEDSTGAETVPGSEEAATAAGAEGQSAEQITAADADKIYDQNGFDPEGYNREGFDKDGFDKTGFNAEGYDKDGFNPEGLNKEGFDRQGFDTEGFDREGFDKSGFDKDGFNQEGYNSEGYDKAGYDREGYDREGMNQADFDRDGYNSQGFDKDGFNREGFDKSGFDREGFDKAGFNAEGFDKEGFNKSGFNKEGFNREGFDQAGFDRDGFDRAGFNAEGFDKEGFNKSGFNKDGFNREGFDKSGFDREGFDKAGFNAEGFDKEGFNKAGFDQDGFNREGFDKSGFDREGFDKAGFNAEGFDKEGFNKAGFDQDGFNREGFDRAGFDREGFDKAGFNAEGFDKEGFNKAGFDKEGFNREGFDKTGFDKEGFNKEGFDKSGFDREGFDKAGFNAEGFDREGFNKAGFDKEGYGRNGFDSEGFDREGYDVNGYDRKGFNRSGFDAKGYDKQGYDKEGFNKDGWDREGYNRKGFDENGWDREGYDKNGYDAEGYDRDGYNREGQSKEGYDTDGYDKKGFNEHGYDRDGYDREGFDFEGYNRSGYDPWGYDKQGFGKDGYHWSGYNADGYNREGMHWTDNPYEEGSIWNVDTYNPFDGRVVDLGGRREAWEPTKPPLGEPYHRTVEKYGAKPWTDEVPQPTPEKPTIPSTEDTGVIGPQDPMNTLKNHGIDQDAPTAPEGQTGTGLPIPEEDIPDAGNIPQDTIPDVPPVSGPQHGDTITLPGKDGRDYQLEYNSQTGEWENLLTGGRIRNEDLGSYVEDFNRWQDDVAEDLSRSARDIEKMAARQDATSQAIDKNLADWKRLEQMQKATDKYNIGEPGGPGDIDKAIQNLKDDMLDGKEVDQDRLEQLNKIIDNRIQGTTAADTGQRWEEDWFKKLGWALEANAATAKEVVTGEKADGSTSWLGMGARIMITTATGGTAGVVMDGGLTVAEAMYRIKDSIDQGESDFRAVSKAIGLTVLGEEAGWLVGAAGSKVMGEMMERFPAFTNKAADLIETAILKGSAKNQMWSKSLGLISKESAEETLDQINKRLVDIGSGEAAENIIKKARTDYGLKSVSDSFDDVSKAGKAFTGSGDDILKGGKSASEGWSDIAEGGGRTVSSSSDDVARGASEVASSSSDDVAKGAGKAASSSDDIAKGGGKAASGSGDDIAKGGRKTVSDSGDDLAKGGGKAASDSSDDMVKGAGTGNRPKAADGADVEPKSTAAGGDGPGDPGGPPSRGGDGDAGSAHSEAINNRTLNTNARTPEEVLSDPASVARAEQSLQKNIKDFDKLPPARQQDLIREQAIYDEYKMQAQERTYNVADKIERREPLTVEDIMEMKADPASMRTLKDLENVDGIGAELGSIRSRQVQSEFNHVLDTEIHRPSYRNVEDHLRTRYPQNGPGEIRCRTVRTPGTEPHPWNINTDNDVIAERLVHGPNGPEWVEIPKAEWEDTYYKAFAENSGFNVDEATRRFPDSDWAKMDDATRFREWAGRHEESAMDQFDLEAARDFSDQRNWRIQDGDLPGRPMIEATPEEIARGVDTVMIDGRPMRPSTAYELVQRRQGNLLDSEQLSMMESYKVDEYWNAGSTPSEVMRNQTEAMEQLRKTASVAQTVESSYRDMGYRIEQMPNNMQEAIKVINNNNLSPAARAARLQELGYETPGDFLNKVTSRIGAIREARI